MAITLYVHGLSMRAVARIFNLSPNAKLKWTKVFAKEHYEKPKPEDAILVESGEMLHYLKSKKTNDGSGKNTEEKLERLLTGSAEGVTRILRKN